MNRSATSTRSSRACLTRGNPAIGHLHRNAEHIRTGYTADNRPVRVMISIVPGDALILQYTIPT